jgi:hypothetical protein
MRRTIKSKEEDVMAQTLNEEQRAKVPAMARLYTEQINTNKSGGVMFVIIGKSSLSPFCRSIPAGWGRCPIGAVALFICTSRRQVYQALFDFLSKVRQNLRADSTTLSRYHPF